jgi:hypothetical protein
VAGYVYRGDKPFVPGSVDTLTRIKSGPRAAPCGTVQSVRRHRRNREVCDYCEAIHEKRLADSAEAVKAKNRRIFEEKNAKLIAEGKQVPRSGGYRLKPCGTVAARNRHKKRGEPVDERCAEAYRVHNRKKRKEERARNKARRLAELKENQ